MRPALLLALFELAACGGNYGYIPVVGAAGVCKEVVDALAARAGACHATDVAAAEVRRRCDNAVAPIPPDDTACLGDVERLPCTEISKIPASCAALFGTVPQ